MIVKSLHLLGFMAHQQSDVVLPERGIVLVTGPNGGGKSSIVEGVATAGWGKTLRGTDPWPEDGGLVRLLTDKVTAERTCKGKKKGLSWGSADGKAAENFETTTKAQEGLESIIGDFEVWRRTHVFSSHDAAHYTLATDGERKRLLEALLGLDRFDPALEACRRDLRAAGTKRAMLNVELERTTALQTAANERLEAARRTLASMPAEVDLTASGVALLAFKAKLDALRKTRTDITARDGALEQLEAAKRVLASLGPCVAVSDTDEQVRQLEAKLKSTQADLRLSREERGALNSKIAVNRSRLDQAQRDIDAVRGSVCSKCGQAIPDALRADHEAKAAEVHAQVEREEADLRQRIKAIDADIEDLEHDEAHFVLAGSNARAEVATEVRMSRQRATSKATVDQAQARADGLNADVFGHDLAGVDAEEAQIRAEHDKLAAEHAAWQATQRQRQAAQAEVASVESKVGLLCGEVDRLQGEHAAAGTDEATLQAVESVLGLKGVRAHVLGKALTGLETAANSWLARLVSREMKLTLRPYSERKSGVISDAISMEVEGAGGGHGYRGASGGERRRIDVALLLALAEVSRAAHGMEAGTIFVDEAFDALDSDGVVAVSDVLRSIAKDRCVVVISHNEELASTLDTRLRLHVKGGTTSVV